MDHYQQTLVIKASPARVNSALTTPEGLRGWWTQDCDYPSEPDGSIRLRFGRNYKELRIEKIEPNREVEWRCIAAQMFAAQPFARKDEWVGTRIVFHLTPVDDGTTRLEFAHVGLVPEFECFELCSDGWRYFMRSLQLFVETGLGTPYELAV